MEHELQIDFYSINVWDQSVTWISFRKNFRLIGILIFFFLLELQMIILENYVIFFILSL